LRATGVAILLLLGAGVAAADYQDGLNAYTYGDYARAMTEWRAVTDGPATAVSPALYIEAHYAVAMLYWQGQGVAVDFRQAHDWLLKAADMGHAAAQARLGFLYTDGEAVARDHQQAFEWFSKAAKGGNVDGLYNLGIFYLYGWGVAQDTALAAQYLAAAAALGDEAAKQALPQVLEQIEAESPEAVGGRLAADAEDIPESRAQSALPQDDAAPEAVGGRLAADTEDIPESRVQSALPQDDAAPEAVGGRSAADTEIAPESRAQSALPQEQSAPVREDREQGSLLLDESWIREQNPQHYTIQVVALRSRESVEELIRDYVEFAPFAVYTVQKGTRPLYVLLQGDYPDVESARLGKERFPRKIQRQDALWIRRFDMVQRLLEP
jgi:septal ring-binding cell division protein DamX